VARALSITEATVKTHLVRVYEKLSVRTRTQLAVLLSGEHTPLRGADGNAVAAAGAGPPV
jgi:Bacterial regulatory proteins, luxR family